MISAHRTLPSPSWFFAVAFSLAACAGELVRGRVSPSHDGGTYLVFDAYDGAACDSSSLRVDGERWPHPLDSLGAIRAGTHTVQCNGDLTIAVDSGTTFRFNYWGP